MRQLAGSYRVQYIFAIYIITIGESRMKSVWLVDDDASIRFVLDKALSRAGFTTESFTNGQDVLTALEYNQPAVLVSDVRMPGIDGMALLEQIHSQHPNLPVIIMTAHSDLDSAVNAFQKGAFEY